MLRRFILIATSLLTFTGTSTPSLAAGAGAVDPTTLNFGMSAPFSGPNGAYGLEMRDIIAAYFQQINASGGIHGRKLQLVALDDGYETERAVANARALVEEKKVFGLIASYGSSTTQAAVNEVLGPAGVPLVGAISGSDAIRQSPKTHPNNRYVFNTRASYADECEAIIGQLTSLGLNRIAVLYQNDAFGTSGLDGIASALRKRGLTTVAAGAVERNSLDVGAAAQAVAQANPQAVIMVALYKPTAAFVRQMKKFGQNPQFVTLSPVGADLLVRELGDDARGIGISQVMPYPWNEVTPVVREYQRLLAKGARPSYYGLEAYIMARTLIDALRKSGRELSREKLIGSLESMQNLDLGGYHISYSPRDHSGSHFVDLTVVGNGGRVLH
ncbi:ABC transporter substrate-binding protein [Rhodocyclus tenuis]|uniref:ABC transporter substrate-binding protein n=1 Tax=Rhodocyclus gracilis TaxID=2929842 RepID=A0ABX0WJ23_9RHOO|nr:ABC transporter substrate-binding protein [Rhodocyclus gracilis]NJA88898.1 ABC transporter substrate-binding protein [Rhodocyclus gracilis]